MQAAMRLAYLCMYISHHCPLVGSCTNAIVMGCKQLKSGFDFSLEIFTEFVLNLNNGVDCRRFCGSHQGGGVSNH